MNRNESRGVVRQLGFARYCTCSSYVSAGIFSGGLGQAAAFSCKPCPHAEALARSANRLSRRAALARDAGDKFRTEYMATSFSFQIPATRDSHVALNWGM